MAILSSLESVEALEALFEASSSSPVVLFKHSRTCGISAHLLELIRSIDSNVNVVTVQSHREVSNAIEQKTGCRHQSPQAFVIKGGKAVYHASHYGIDPEAISSHLESAE